jgi:hypothetical protein
MKRRNLSERRSETFDLRVEMQTFRLPDSASVRYGDSCMKRRSSSRLIVVLGLVAIGSIFSRGQTNTIIVPKEAETEFGDSYESGFHGLGHFQQIYSQSLFSSLPEVIVITEMGIRANETGPQADDTVVREVPVVMSIFTGDEWGWLPYSVTVLSNKDVAVKSSSGDLGVFHFWFVLDKPFTYDRRLGPLFVQVGVGRGHSGELPFLDAHFSNQGTHIYLEPHGFRRFHGTIMATKILYVVPPRITNVRRVGESLQIEFSHAVNTTDFQIEASSTVAGSYGSQEGISFVTISPTATRAIIPRPKEHRFYRIVQP